jgi:hypothetical protein
MGVMMAETTESKPLSKLPLSGRMGTAAAPAAQIVAETDLAIADALIERKNFKIRLADTERGRNSASLLINKMYGWRGYGDEHEVKPDPNRITITATDKQYLIGTITLGIDSEKGLLADEIFKAELDAFRSAGGKVCELTKLAVDPNIESKFALASLFHILFIYGRRINNCTDVFIEVNPRHRRFYETMLGFTRLGGVRTNPRVNAPAQLLWINLASVEQQIVQHGGTSDHPADSRSLYPYFFSKAEEDGIYGRLLALG